MVERVIGGHHHTDLFQTESPPHLLESCNAGTSSSFVQHVKQESLGHQARHYTDSFASVIMRPHAVAPLVAAPLFHVQPQQPVQQRVSGGATIATQFGYPQEFEYWPQASLLRTVIALIRWATH